MINCDFPIGLQRHGRITAIRLNAGSAGLKIRSSQGGVGSSPTFGSKQFRQTRYLPASFPTLRFLLAWRKSKTWKRQASPITEPLHHRRLSQIPRTPADEELAIHRRTRGGRSRLTGG